MTGLTTKSTTPSFAGQLIFLNHASKSTGTDMTLNLYLPPQAIEKAKPAAKSIPVLFYLAGLTCTGDNGAQKAGFQAHAAEKGIAIVFPDTSPRGLDLPEEHASWDFGSGAGFYLNATTSGYSSHYKMYDYITSELPSLLYSTYPFLDSSRVSIFGHSMGGHGALVAFLKNPGMYKSVSAFAPIANPTKCPWGEKAFKGYLEGGVEEGKKWDATELVGIWKKDSNMLVNVGTGDDGKGDLDVLIDVGTGDDFYKKGQLLPENFAKAAEEAGLEKGVTVRYQEGYDHSYYFIASFAKDHIDHHAKYLLAK